jgi:hypothetical protein
VTVSPTIRAATVGDVLLLVDARTGQLHATPEPGGAAWVALANTGETGAAAVRCGLGTAEVNRLTDTLIHFGLLRSTNVPRPWPEPARVAASAPSWGTRTVPVRLETLTSPSVSQRAMARLALAVTLAARQSARPRGVDASFGRLVQLTEWAARRARRPATHDDAARAVNAVRWAGRHWPARVACLEESVAATILLGLRRLQVTWCHGVAADPIHLHAWIQAGDRPVAEPETTNHYTPLLQVPADAATMEDQHG